MSARIMIVSDEKGHWYIRYVHSVCHDLTHDRKIYRCDQPIGTRFKKLDDAVKLVKLLERRR